jgi:hypothetical protein
MDPIPVPPPSPSAFNKNRPPSDLLQSQLSYFQHLQLRHGHEVPAATAQAVTTEDGAARYIAHMTRLIREKALAEKRGTKAESQPSLKLVPKRKPAPAPATVTAIAATAAKPVKAKPAKPKPATKPTKRRKP